MVDFGLADVSDLAEITKMARQSFPAEAVFMCGKQNNSVIMWFAFGVLDNRIEIFDIYALDNDEKLLCFCGRAGLNALDLTGFREIESKNDNIKDILYKLGFQKEKDLFHLFLTDDYFKAGCCK